MYILKRIDNATEHSEVDLLNVRVLKTMHIICVRVLLIDLILYSLRLIPRTHAATL